MFPGLVVLFYDRAQTISNSRLIVGTAFGNIVLYAAIWFRFWRLNRSHFYYFDAQDISTHGDLKLPVSAPTGTFAPMLKNYLDVTRLVITLAAASITFGGNNSRVRGIFVAKIFLAFSILFGVLFCAFVLYRYDEYAQDVQSYTRFWYCTVEAFAFSTLISFFVGYGAWAVNLNG